VLLPQRAGSENAVTSSNSRTTLASHGLTAIRATIFKLTKKCNGKCRKRTFSNKKTAIDSKQSREAGHVIPCLPSCCCRSLAAPGKRPATEATAQVQFQARLLLFRKSNGGGRFHIDLFIRHASAGNFVFRSRQGRAKNFSKRHQI